MKRFALCVGINDFIDPSAGLNGCKNDSVDWGAALEQRGYDVSYLHDSDATKANITFALRDIVARAKWRDRIVFTISSHGTWVPDRDGDEADRRDEALVCHDFELIIDDELHHIFRQARYGVRRVVVADTCHSGTVARLFNDGRGVKVQGRPRFLTPSYLGLLAPADELRLEAAPRASRSRLGALLMGGAMDHEFAYDAYIAGRYRGAFTAHALAALAKEPRTFKAWHQRIDLPTEHFPQTPTLVGTAYQKRWRPLS